MLKRLAHISKIRQGVATSADPLTTSVVEIGGVGLLIAEAVVLLAQGSPELAACLFAVFAASTLSSVAGFAFSGHRRPAGASSNSTAATIGSAPKTSVMMTISIGVPISSGELREGGGDIIGKWKQERQRNRQEQANHGEAKRRQYIGIP